MSRLQAKCAERSESSAEDLLQLGLVVRALVRHGAHVSELAGDLDVGRRVCELALRFVCAPDWFKFRVLVEEWRILAIRRVLDDPWELVGKPVLAGATNTASIVARASRRDSS
jgi:hypothetical protein